MNSQERVNFIDWMKAVGMFLIVFGHVVGDPFSPFIPIYPKQLGVAFFVFVTGWSLANEKRSRIRIIFNRIFPVYFWGITFAVVLSIIAFFIKNDLNLSNYMPFVFGINVFVNYFPANPTTWYIGTYLHLLVFWAFFFYDRSVKIRMLLLALCCEVVIRAMMIHQGKSMMTYMFLTNWITIFLLGLLIKSKSDEATSKVSFYYIVILAIFFIIWGLVMELFNFTRNFPFLLLHDSNSIFPPIFISLCISIVYFLYTLLGFEICRRLPNYRFIRFLSSNTLIIFIVHLPLIFYVSPYVYSLMPNVFLKKTAMITIAYLGLAVASSQLQQLVNVKAFRENLWKRFSDMLNGIVL